MIRRQLPTRRELDAFEFDMEGVHYHASIGRFRPAGPLGIALQLAEIDPAARPKFSLVPEVTA